VTALSERDFPRDEKMIGGMTTLYMRVPTATIELFRGGLVAHRIGSKLAEVIDPAAPRSDLVIVGWADNYVRATTTAWSVDATIAADADDQPLTVNVKGDGWLGRGFDSGAGVNALTANDVDAIVFAYDSNTLYKTDAGGTLSPAGRLACYDTVNSLATLDIRAPKIANLLNAVAAGGSGGVEVPRAVVTTLAANTVTAGVMTADAAGAFGTQDGVSTLVAGDTVFIQAGTTNLDAAADAGPWEIQTLGTVSVAFVLRRPSWWAHGSPIKQSAQVRMSGEGTLYPGATWQSFAANTAVVGTDDPVMFADQVTQSIVLVAGHLAVTNVAIRSATKTNYIMRRITANTCTLTLEYVPLTITPGALGTATVDITAAVAAGTINVADISTLLLSIVNF
jgi:hypothetical protein